LIKRLQGGIVGRVGRATARDALCLGFDPCRQRPRGVAVDFGPKQSGWLINQLGDPSFTRLERTNPSVGIDRMDNCQAIHHEMHFFRLHAMMPRKRSILSEEASGAIKTLKRLERTNPSVRMDRMDDYLAIHHKTSDSPSRYPLSMSEA
jgi:hypothetical protein